MTSSNQNIFSVSGHLCGEFTGNRWIPRTKASDAGALVFSLIYAWITGWVNHREAGDLRCTRAQYDVIVMNRQIFINLQLCDPFTKIIENQHGDKGEHK